MFVCVKYVHMCATASVCFVCACVYFFFFSKRSHPTRQKVPLSGGTVDVAVFCLSLMGTNLTDYLKEARRVLKKGDEEGRPNAGILKVGEYRKRGEVKEQGGVSQERKEEEK